MITVLVSSKTMTKKPLPADLDLDSSLRTPEFEEEASRLNNELRKFSKNRLKKLMHISDNLAGEVHEKVVVWNQMEAWPAWLLFSGDVYKGLVAETLSKEDLEWAQNRVWTLSGLYGIARPLDGIKPYRLEAGYKLRISSKKNLYEFWGNKIAKKIEEQYEDETVLNLSSEEYIRLIRKDFKGKIITPLFLQDRETGLKPGVKFEAVHAKVARGAMARWIILNRIERSEMIRSFTEDGYKFDEARSSELEPVFIRKSEGVMKIAKVES